MPRELTRRPDRFQILQGELGFDIHEQDKVVRVTLSGILDRSGLADLVRCVSPRLCSRGRTVVLDGRRLDHIDYRAVPALVAWNKAMRTFDHSLLLSDWNSYLKTILLVGDWGAEPARMPVRRLRGGKAASARGS